MSFNSFDYYQQLREYQLHIKKVANPQTHVPTHQAFKPKIANTERVKQFQRQQKIAEIEHQNEVIMSKLVKINRRKPQISKSVSSLSLPPIKKNFSIPIYEQQNTKIAKKIITAKSNINLSNQIQNYKSVETRKRNISKYHNQDGVIINRKKYLAELMLLKKMRLSQIIRNNK